MRNANDPSTVDAILTALRADEVVAIPTDTVYGLAANPQSRSAMKKLFELKERPEGVPVAVLAASLEQARSLVVPSETFEQLASLHWPGALTLVALADPQAGLYIGETTNDSGLPTVGVRVPDHDLVQQCAESFGPIAVTSANVHGEPTIVNPEHVRTTFGDRVAVVVNGGLLDGLASTVVDVSQHEMIVLRAGVVQVD